MYTRESSTVRRTLVVSTHLADGIASKHFELIPKDTDQEASASTMFKKCLFRLEIAQECQESQHMQKLESRLLEWDLDEEEDEY